MTKTTLTVWTDDEKVRDLVEAFVRLLGKFGLARTALTHRRVKDDNKQEGMNYGSGGATTEDNPYKHLGSA